MKKDTFGEKIRVARLKKNLTQQDLADKIGVTSVSISYYETGKKKPSFDKTKLLCGVLNITIKD